VTLHRLIRRLRTAAYAAAFPIYSLVSPKLGFTIFFRRQGAWHAYSRGRSFRIHEPRLWAMEYFRHFVPAKGAVVLDVGGELGFESAQFANLVGEKGKVIVFECMPEHVKGLQALSAKHSQMSVVNCACWNEVTQLEFFLGNTPGSNTAVPDAKGQRGQTLASSAGASLKVDAKPLDLLWKELLNKQPVDFLKMDIEGAEYEALEGAKEMLTHTRFAVIAAYHIRDNVPTARRVDQMLKASGFKTRVDENLHVYAWR
jgi:FkbM family methyltransferase